MQREIKFRAKVKGDAGIWNVWKIDWLNLLIELDGARGGVWTPMDKIQSLMQFTGLHDAKGKEIYEGDVLKKGELKYLVEFSYGMFGIQTNRYGFKPLLNPHFFEIIGNIHENSDLLK